MAGVIQQREKKRTLACVESVATATSAFGVCVRWMKNELGAQITGFRSKVVSQVCSHIARVVKIMERELRKLANDLLSSLVSTAKGASGAVHQPGAMLLKVISEHVRYDLRLLPPIAASQVRTNMFLRMSSGFGMRLFFVYYHDECSSESHTSGYKNSDRALLFTPIPVILEN